MRPSRACRHVWGSPSRVVGVVGGSHMSIRRGDETTRHESSSTLKGIFSTRMTTSASSTTTLGGRAVKKGAGHLEHRPEPRTNTR
ncbi:hypothetical protein VUR80DRAFT_4938 [Thermomyces stellatus]